MTILQKIQNLTWWNEIAKLKDILIHFINISIVEAPIDGTQYARKNGEWAEVVGGSGGNQDLQSVLDNGNVANNSITLSNTSLNKYIYLTDGYIGSSNLEETTLISLSPNNNNPSLDIVKDNNISKLFSNPSSIATNDFYLPIGNNSSKTLATLEDVNNIDTAFAVKTYTSTMSVAYNSEQPNFDIHLTGNLDLTITGTANGDSGMVNLYFVSTEVATLNGVTDLVITGAGEMIPVYFIHDSDGIKWYKDEVGGSGGTANLIEYVKITDGKNLLNKAYFIDGSNINTDGTINYYGAYLRTNYIELSPSTQYILSALSFSNYVFFNSTYGVLDNASTGTFTTPVGTKYIIINLDATYRNVAQLELGASETTFVDYQKTVKDYLIDNNVRYKNQYIDASPFSSLVKSQVGNTVICDGSKTNYINLNFFDMEVNETIVLESHNGTTYSIQAPVGVLLNFIDNNLVDIVSAVGSIKVATLRKVATNEYTIIQ
jgi:hypothetical protein